MKKAGRSAGAKPGELLKLLALLPLLRSGALKDVPKSAPAGEKSASGAHEKPDKKTEGKGAAASAAVDRQAFLPSLVGQPFR